MKKVVLLSLMLPILAHAQTPTLNQCVGVGKDLIIVRDYLETCKLVVSDQQALQVALSLQSAEAKLFEHARQCRPVIDAASETVVKQQMDWDKLSADIKAHEVMPREQRVSFCSAQMNPIHTILQKYH